MNNIYKCNICQNELNNVRYYVREMMYGSRKKYEYQLCSNCNTLQLKNNDKDIQKYYPKDYYSYSNNIVDQNAFLIKQAKLIRYKLVLEWKESFISKIIKRKIPLYNYLSLSNVSKSSSILEIGCGNGSLLCWLANEGFEKLVGIDPYIDKDIYYKNGVSIYKKYLSDISGKYDIIILNHVFEHFENPHTEIISLKKLLNDNGKIIIRTPVMDKWAWREYAENWVQIDAPRHFYIYSEQSMRYICNLYNLVVTGVYYDSDVFQFWGSIQNQKNIPLNDNRSWVVNKKTSIFTEKEIDFYKKKSQELNLAFDGDQACFLIEIL